MQTGKLLEEQKAHSDTVCDLQMSSDGSHLVTASKDKTAKLLDAQTLEVMKTYPTEYPVNTASLSPKEDHVCRSAYYSADMQLLYQHSMHPHPGEALA